MTNYWRVVYMCSYYPVKSRTKDGGWFAYTFADIPCYINSEEFVLLNRKQSPILLAGEVLMGCDIPDVFEGDIIMDTDTGEQYTVQYIRGIVLTGEKRKYLYEVPNFMKVGEARNADGSIPFPVSKKLYFKYNNVIMYPRSIYGAIRNKMVLEGFHTVDDMTQIREDARCTYKDQKLFFGDLVDGQVLYMHYGRPVINTPDGKIFDVICEKYIPKEGIKQDGT